MGESGTPHAPHAKSRAGVFANAAQQAAVLALGFDKLGKLGENRKKVDTSQAWIDAQQRLRKE